VEELKKEEMAEGEGEEKEQAEEKVVSC